MKDFLEGLEILEILENFVAISRAARQGGVVAAGCGRVGCWLLCVVGCLHRRGGVLAVLGGVGWGGCCLRGTGNF